MEEQYKWDFKDFFASDEDFLNEFKNYKNALEKVRKEFSSLSLEDKLKKYYELSLQSEKLITYAELNSDLNLKNETYQKFKNDAYSEKRKLEELKGSLSAEIINENLSLNEYMKNPNLKPFYMHFYEILRNKEHTVSNSAIINETKLVQRVNSLYNTIVSVEMPKEEAEIEGSVVKVNSKVYNQYITNQDRNLREKVFKTFMKSLKNVNQSIAGLFNMRYELYADIAKEKGYKSILEGVIKEDDLDERITENLIETVHENQNLVNRYIDLKKKKLSLEELHFYDLNINSDYNPKYTFTEGIEIVKEALKDFGPVYTNTLNKVLEDGIIDAYPNKHKFGGGYHWRNYTKPMILMNYKENFHEVATIGHELGHAVNGILIRDNQDYQNFHFSIFLSEIASMVNEDRVEEYMFEMAPKENKIIHLEQIIDKTITALFLQTLFFEFQQEICTKIENGKSVSAEEMNQAFLSFMQKYYPNLEVDEEIKYLWQTRIHFFYDVHKYYNFQYATGKIASLVINKNIKEGRMEEYLEFLKTGGSKPTLEALSIAGVDLTQKQVYQDAFHYLEGLLDKYEALLK